MIRIKIPLSTDILIDIPAKSLLSNNIDREKYNKGLCKHFIEIMITTLEDRAKSDELVYDSSG